MRLALLAAALLVVSVPLFAQDRQSFIEGFGGLRLAIAPTISPNAGATVGIGLAPHIQAIGEVGRMRDVLPSTLETLLSVSPVGFRTAAFYGEGGVRFTTNPFGHVGAYGETLAGLARLTNSVNGLGSTRTDAITNLALRLSNGTDRIASLGTGVILQGGPMVATIGYRYSRIFANNFLDTVLTTGHADINEARLSLGVRF